MKRLRTLLVTFSNDIPAYMVTAFRAAIIEKVGREEVAFHNHVGDTQYVYQYPLICINRFLQYLFSYSKLMN